MTVTSLNLFLLSLWPKVRVTTLTHSQLCQSSDRTDATCRRKLLKALGKLQNTIMGKSWRFRKKCELKAVFYFLQIEFQFLINVNGILISPLFQSQTYFFFFYFLFPETSLSQSWFKGHSFLWSIRSVKAIEFSISSKTVVIHQISFELSLTGILQGQYSFQLFQ